ncbi:MAG: hypothetical protein HKN04_09255 [Rhodothermaceae bacterium]|nr:hypothetical protein [Rhodothermaceae bacterium]
MPRLLLLGLAVLLLAVRPVEAQPESDWPEADPADVESIEAIIAAIYDVISGPATEDRDWDRFRSLMHQDGRLMPLAVQGEQARPIVWSVEDYVELASNQFRNAPIFQGKGFYEVESSSVVERYDRMAHVWSTYESRLDPAEDPFARGINSFQLYHDGERWWVLNIFWEQESEAAPIPAEYLPSDD